MFRIRFLFIYGGFMSHLKLKELYGRTAGNEFHLILNGRLDHPEDLISLKEHENLIDEPEVFMYMVPETDVNEPSGRILKARFSSQPQTIEILCNEQEDLLISRQDLEGWLKKGVFRIEAQASEEDGTTVIRGSVFAGDHEPVDLSIRLAESEDSEAEQPELAENQSKDHEFSELSSLRRYPVNSLRLMYGAMPELDSGFEIRIPSDRVSDAVADFESLDDSLSIPLKDLIQDSKSMSAADSVSKSLDYMKRFGFRKTLSKVIEKGSDHFAGVSYHNYALTQIPAQARLDIQKKTRFEYEPLISIVTAAWNTPVQFLEEMVTSLQNQSYSNWELCLADGSDHDEVRDWIRTHPDERIRYLKLKENYGIAENMNRALEMVQGDYIGFLDHDDLLRADCLYKAVEMLQHKNFDMIYTDEDKLIAETGEFAEPHYKPNFSIDLLRSENYITHFLLVSREIADQLGGFRSEYDGSQDYDYILRASEISKSVGHIPEVLYHWRSHQASTAQNSESKLYCFENGKKAIEDHLKRCGQNGRVSMLPSPYLGKYRIRYHLNPEEMISVIASVSDAAQAEILAENLAKRNSWPEYELILISEDSIQTSPEEHPCLGRLYKNERLTQISAGSPSERIQAFNQAAVDAAGNILLFLDGSLQIKEKDSLYEMASLAFLEHAGAVGAKILDSRGLVRSFGQIIRADQEKLSTPAFYNEEYFSAGYQGRSLVVSDFSAVDGRCLMIQKDRFLESGGFFEEYAEGGYDAELCLRLLKKGLWNMAVPFAVFYYDKNDSKSAQPVSASNAEQLRKILPANYRRYDPFYNPNFEKTEALFRIPQI